MADKLDTLLEKDDSKIEIHPEEYFNAVKERKNTITDEALVKLYDNCIELINKYMITGQTRGLRKILFCIDSIERERELVKMGINTFVYRDDVDFYIDQVAKNTVKIIELERYEREIPDEIVEIIAKVKDKFDQLYIVFTDYTGKEERKVEAERRQKDPILFGTFQDKEKKVIIDRFYYLGDWVDEYCDLTLDKMVNETERVGKRNIVRTISTPEDIEALRDYLNNHLEIEKNSVTTFRMKPDKEKEKAKKNVFSKIKTFLNRDTL